MDVFGEALRAYHAGRTEEVIHITRDDGWVDDHSPGVYFRDAPSPVEAAALAHAEGPLLDVGCGAGRHLLWCAGQGIAAHGIDVSPGAIAVCRERGLENVVLHDIMGPDQPNLPERPRTITLFGNNVGIGGDFAGAVALFARLHRIAAPKGRLLLTGIDIARTDEPAHLSYHARNRAAGRRRGEIGMSFAYDGQVAPEIPWYHPEPNEVDDLAQASGWTVAQLARVGPFFWAMLERS
ncbi:class I SAM-dependent methyltransferase [Jannaschia marina]|uniref:class I SAM-dependent methyltransferase n=1 Tax=Jannaschia marina TaxID=2741674 RepID=UPI0015C6D8E9|nr:class I SAM-dependent methyltransferase [Jannaschia marina]